MKITAILKNREKGYFTTNAAALHILFGKEWDKKEWKKYKNPFKINLNYLELVFLVC